MRKKPVRVRVAADGAPPLVTHARIDRAKAGESIRIEANAVDPSGVKSVNVRFRSVTQYQEYASIPMFPTGQDNRYSGEIPGHYLDPRWDFMYYIEAFDTMGNGTMYPDVEKEAPYIIVKLER